MHNPITRELIHSLHTTIDTIATKYSIADTIDIDLTPTLRELEIVADTLFKRAFAIPHYFDVEYDIRNKRHRDVIIASDIEHLLEQLPANASVRKITSA